MIFRFIIIPQFQGFVNSSRCTGWHCCTKGTKFSDEINLRVYIILLKGCSIKYYRYIILKFNMLPLLWDFHESRRSDEP